MRDSDEPHFLYAEFLGQNLNELRMADGAPNWLPCRDWSRSEPNPPRIKMLKLSAAHWRWKEDPGPDALLAWYRKGGIRFCLLSSIQASRYSSRLWPLHFCADIALIFSTYRLEHENARVFAG